MHELGQKSRISSDDPSINKRKNKVARENRDWSWFLISGTCWGLLAMKLLTPLPFSEHPPSH